MRSKCVGCLYWDGENCCAYSIQELIDMEQRGINCEPKPAPNAALDEWSE